MGKRMGVVSSVGMVAGLAGMLVAFPAAGEAGEMTAGAKHTLSLTKDYTSSPWTSETGWSNRAIGKLGFGAKNLLLGWTDIFVKPKQAVESGDNLLMGIGKGVVEAVGNTVGGAVHVVTFPITCLDAPLPGGGVQLLSS